MPTVLSSSNDQRCNYDPFEIEHLCKDGVERLSEEVESSTCTAAPAKCGAWAARSLLKVASSCGGKLPGPFTAKESAGIANELMPSTPVVCDWENVVLDEVDLEEDDNNGGCGEVDLSNNDPNLEEASDCSTPMPSSAALEKRPQFVRRISQTSLRSVAGWLNERVKDIRMKVNTVADDFE